jgi:ABC-type multidrug transport system fused ATPase/permease subunit
LNDICFRITVDIESGMTAVERVLEYCSLDQEPPAQVLPKQRPPSDWPSQGRIVCENISMSYSNDEHAPLTLHNISLTIEGGEKVGIVGRTGAGKSSFIQILFRMGILVDGQIRIDNINIAEIGLDDLRNRISIIPQDPVLFTGTMRSNLDRFNNYSDNDIWHALEQV